MQEKRRYRRLRIELPASFESVDQEDAIAVATTLDISAGGLCLTSREGLDIGQTLLLRIQLPNGERLSILVEVVWLKTQEVLSVTEFQVGLRIIDPTQPDEDRFIRFCKDY